MWLIYVVLAVVVLMAIGVIVYVAFPHRGNNLPALPWVGDAMAKGVNALPTIDESEDAHLKL